MYENRTICLHLSSDRYGVLHVVVVEAADSEERGAVEAARFCLGHHGQQDVVPLGVAVLVDLHL